MKAAAAVLAAFTALIVAVAAVTGVVLTGLTPPAGDPAARPPSVHAVRDIPPDYLAVYRVASHVCPGLDWAVLAAIGKIETDHGRSRLPGVASGENDAGAGGPMQILQPTWQDILVRHRLPPGGLHPPSRYDPHDAIHAAAFYLCDHGAGAGRDLHGAIFAYNHADWYVRNVLDQAHAYRGAQPTPTAPTSPVQARGWVVPTRGRCSSGFGLRHGALHRGQDIAAPTGTPVVAAHSGTVIESGPARGYGLWIRIEHPGGVISTYGHNHRNLVRAGEPVSAGQSIAEVGSRGQSTGPHLHFQLDLNNHAIDPARYFDQQHAPPLCTRGRAE